MYSKDLFSKETYIHRRKVLKEKVGSGLILLPGNEESSINFKDNWYPFRQDSTFLYYFGLNLPGLTAIINVDNDVEIIFADELSLDDIIWTGSLPSIQSLAELVGVKNVLATSKLKESVKQAHKPHFLPPYRPEHTQKLTFITGYSSAQIMEEASVPLISAIVAQRSIKSSEEIEELEVAVTASSKMHLQVMRSARVGMMEYELVGEAYKSAVGGGMKLAFPAILTTNGQILHNHYHGNALREGDMVLFDGGLESFRCYAGDLTRTFPAGNKFTTRQKEIYQIVLNAHEKVIASLQPGVLFRDMHLLACKELVEGLKMICLMKGDTDEAVNAGAHTLFFQCGLGHMLGLDVHDMENLGEEYVGYSPDLVRSKEFGLKSLRLGKELEQGFAITVEPGIYFIPELIALKRENKSLHQFIDFDLLETYENFGGIRIEDDFLITENGSVQLGEPLPRSVEDVEAIRYSADDL